ncbi:hypothetical protein NeNHUV3_21980 [Nereida sp. NH-UV-3]
MQKGRATKMLHTLLSLTGHKRLASNLWRVIADTRPVPYTKYPCTTPDIKENDPERTNVSLQQALQGAKTGRAALDECLPIWQ